jgi:transposase
MRRGHDGLVAIVRNQWKLDPFEGSLYAFVGKRRDRLKVLFWDRGGFVLYYKRLEAGHFRLPKVSPSATHVQIDMTHLAMLLDGIDVSRVSRPALWEPRP